MKIDIYNGINELSQSVASLFIEVAQKAIADRGRFLVALSGGSTPMKLYERLAGNKLDWTRVHFFWGDERCVPADDLGNNYGQTKQVLFDKIGDTNIHRINSDLAPDSAATDYARTLKAFSDPPLDFPRFDLVLLGMGEDGHTASLFPGSPVEVDSPALAVTAYYQDRPANRVTLTPKVFNLAREIWFLVAGANKAETLQKVLKGEFQPKVFPAQRIKPVNGNLVWMIDEEAASLL